MANKFHLNVSSKRHSIQNLSNQDRKKKNLQSKMNGDFQSP